MDNRQNFVENNLVILTKQTLDYFLTSECPAELISLYTFYYYTAKWQETNQPKCTTQYVAKGLKWSEPRVQKYKKMLKESGLLEDVAVRGDNGKIAGHYIKLNFLFSKSTVDHPIGFAGGGSCDGVAEIDPNALSANSINALSANSINAYTPLTPHDENKKQAAGFGFTEALALISGKVSQRLEEQIAKWFVYKSERKDKYTQTGGASLINKIEKAVGKYGDEAVISVIEDTIAAGYQGIVWDWLDKKKQVAETPLRRSERILE